MANPKNTRWLALFPQDVRIVMKKAKHAVHIMVFGVVRSNGNVMSQFTFPHYLRLNMEAYDKCLEELVLSWMKRMTAEGPYIWQYDSVTCYTIRGTQSWLWQNFYDLITPKIWPLNPQDCNLLDYYVWVAVE